MSDCGPSAGATEQGSGGQQAKLVLNTSSSTTTMSDS